MASCPKPCDPVEDERTVGWLATSNSSNSFTWSVNLRFKLLECAKNLEELGAWRKKSQRQELTIKSIYLNKQDHSDIPICWSYRTLSHDSKSYKWF